MSSIVFYKILCFVHPGPLKGRRKDRIKHARILLREVVCVRENRENRERAGRPWSRLIPDPEWRQEEGWAKHLGLLCRLKKFQQNCPESLSQNQLSEVSWVSQEWNCLCSSAPALVGWEQLRKVWHVVNLQRLPVMGGLQVHSHGGHIYIGFIWNTQE